MPGTSVLTLASFSLYARHVIICVRAEVKGACGGNSLRPSGGLGIFISDHRLGLVLAPREAIIAAVRDISSPKKLIAGANYDFFTA